MNTVQLVGRLTRDIELKFTAFMNEGHPIDISEDDLPF